MSYLIQHKAVPIFKFDLWRMAAGSLYHPSRGAGSGLVSPVSDMSHYGSEG